MGINSRILIVILLGVVAALVAAAGAAFIGQGADLYNNEAEDTIVFAHVMFRHGNRTPTKPTFPTDRYKDFSFYPIGWAQLTNGGKMRMYQSGQFLRHRYGRFLGDVLDDAVMQVKSTDTPRTKNSASLVGAGLWPPADRWDDGTGSKSNPVPFEVIPKKQDNLLYLYRVPCPAFDRDLERAKNSPRSRELLNSFSELREYLSKHTGLDVQSPVEGYNIYQTLRGQKEFGLELPSWSENIFPQLEHFAGYFLSMHDDSQKRQRLRSGVLLREITANSIAAATNSLQPKGRKIVLYSGHDTTLANLLVALNVFNYKLLPYGSMLMIELHRIPGAVEKTGVPDSMKALYRDASKPLPSDSWNNLHQYGVQMLLRNSTWHDPYPLTLPNCVTLCPLDRFVQLTSHMVVTDWHAECKY